MNCQLVQFSMAGSSCAKHSLGHRETLPCRSPGLGWTRQTLTWISPAKFCSRVQPSPLLEREGQAVRTSCTGGPDTGQQEKVKLIATPAAALADSEQLLAAAGSVFPFHAL